MQAYLKKWCKGVGHVENVRSIVDWEYYFQRLSGTVQKIITIPAAMQKVGCTFSTSPLGAHTLPLVTPSLQVAHPPFKLRTPSLQVTNPPFKLHEYMSPASTQATGMPLGKAR